METDKFILFYSHKPNKTNTHYFSQWYPINFTEKFDEKTLLIFENAEQYMMAHKALLFGDYQSYEKIMNTRNPSEIKKIGRSISDFNSDIWDQNKFNIVINGNRLKFGQNPILLERLLDTGNKYIAETSPHDKIWGIGLTAQQALKVSQTKWPGKNLLGHALMIIREENQK